MAIKQRQTADGIVYDVYVQNWNVHGKRIQKRKCALKSLKSAREAETLLRAGLVFEKGKPQRLTYGMWLGKFMERLRVEGRPSTNINYISAQTKWILPDLKDVFLDAITPTQLHEIILQKPQTISLNMKKTILDQVRRVLAAAVDEGVLLKNPALPIKIKVPEVKQAVLNATEVECLLREARTCEHRFYPVWAMALLTGMRSGEMFALRWTDIDSVNKRVSINKAWSNKGGIGPTKSQRNRVVPISEELFKLLNKLRTQSTSPDDFVLPRLQEWHDGSQADVLRKFCRAIGITSVKFHDLRATFITQMLLKGVPLAQVMAIVGHSELHTTNRYLRVAGADLEGATDRLGFALPSDELANVIQLPYK